LRANHTGTHQYQNANAQHASDKSSSHHRRTS
jgi:hypothetical protein